MRRQQVQELTDRVRKVAQGAALMTETTVEERDVHGLHNYLPNMALGGVARAALEELGAIDFTGGERAFAHTLALGYPETTRAASLAALEIPASHRGQPLLADFLPPTDIGKTMSGSTDVAEVSWLAPTVQITTNCWAPGVPGHSWGITASGGMSIGHKGMLHAAKAMALTATMLHDDPATIARARDEHRESLGGRSYRAPLPVGAVPPLPRP